MTPTRPLASLSTAQPTHFGTGYFEMARDEHRLFDDASLRVRRRRREVRATHRIVREFCEGVQELTFELVQRPRQIGDKGVGLGRKVLLEGRHALDPTIILE